MEKIINELVELSKEGCKYMLIAYTKNCKLSIYEEYNINYIPKIYQLGLINLEVYTTYDDIKEELNNMLQEYKGDKKQWINF